MMGNEEVRTTRASKGFKKVVTLFVLVIVLVIGLFLVFKCVKVIPAGYVGVVYNMNGGVEDKVRTQGWTLVPPTKKITQYSIATQQVYLSADEREGSPTNESFNATCKDGMVNVDLEMSYHFEPEIVPQVFNKYAGLSGDKVIEVYIRGKLKTFVSEVTSRYSVLDVVMDKKAEVNAEITKYLGERLKEFGISVETATLSRIQPDAAVSEAISNRSVLAQQLEVEKKKQEKAQLEAETKRITAEGEAAKKKIEAENAAEIEKIKADAEAYSNKKISESLTNQLILKMEMEARLKHGWVVIQGGEPVLVTPNSLVEDSVSGSNNSNTNGLVFDDPQEYTDNTEN